MTNPIDIEAKTKDEFISKVKEWALKDSPEGTHYFQISAKLLYELIKSRGGK